MALPYWRLKDQREPHRISMVVMAENRHQAPYLFWRNSNSVRRSHAQQTVQYDAIGRTRQMNNRRPPLPGSHEENMTAAESSESRHSLMSSTIYKPSNDSYRTRTTDATIPDPVASLVEEACRMNARYL